MRKRDVLLSATGIVLAGAIFAADRAGAPEGTTAALYVVPLLIAGRSQSRNAVLAAALIATLLTIIPVLKSSGIQASTPALLIRGITLAALWITAAVVSIGFSGLNPKNAGSRHRGPLVMNRGAVADSSPAISSARATGSGERIRTARLLLQRTTELETLAENAPDLIVRVDRDLRLVFVNQRISDFTGLTVEQCMGKTMREADLPPAFSGPLERATTLVFQTGQPQEIEFSHAGPRGVRHSQSRIVPEFTTESGVATVLTITRDVTNRKQADDLLRIQRDLAVALSTTSDFTQALALVFNAAVQIEGIDCGAVHVLDPISQQFDLVFQRNLSDSFAQSIRRLGPGTPEAELVSSGQPFYKPVSELHVRAESLKEEGIRGVASNPILHDRRIVAVLNLGSHTQNEFSITTRHSIELIAADLGGALVRIQAAEALQASEERYRWLAEFSPEAIIVEGRGRVLYANAAAAHLFGAGSASELVGKVALDLVAPAERKAAEIRSRRVDLQGAVAPLDRHALRLDGRLVPVEVSAARVIYDGEPAHQITLREITERKQAEAARQQAHAELERRVAQRTVELQTANDRLRQEIAEREQTAAALRQSEERFRQMAENVSEGFWMATPGGRDVLYVNPAMETIHGRSAEQFYRQPWSWLDPIEPVDRPRMAAILPQQLKGGGTEIEYRLKRPDGSIRWVHERAIPIRDEHGQVYRVVGVTQDITHRRAAEDALRESENRFNEALEHSRQILYRFNFARNCYDYLSHYVEELSGWTVEEYAKRGFAEIVADVHPDDRAQVVAAFENAEGARGGEKSFLAREYRLRTKNGTYRWVSDWAVMLFDEHGERRSVVGSAHDITDRKQAEEALRESEERFRRIFEEGPIGIAIVQMDMGFLKVNPAFRSMLGYEEGELDGLTFKDITHPDDVRLHLTLAEKLIRGEIPSYQIEKRYVKKTGEQVWGQLTAGMVRDEGGRPLYGLTMIEDITQRRLAEQEAQRHHAEVAHFQRISTMGEMVSGLAHELNQPLSAIVNYTRGCIRRIRSVKGRLSDGVASTDSGTQLSGDLVAILDQVVEQATRASEIIRRLRSFIRKRDPKRSHEDINALIREAVSFVENDVRRAAVGMRLDLAPALPAVTVDAIQIEQVILNLVRNAIEALGNVPPAQRELVVRTECKAMAPGRVPAGEEGEGPKERGWIEVTVHDAGRGIPAEQLDRVFDAFYTTKPEGMGLGLSISRSIVEAHHGRIRVASPPEGGTIFTFTLPIEDGANDNGF